MIRPAKHIALVSQAFDPFLRDGGSRSLLTRLHFLKGQGCQVSILSFQATDTRSKLVFGHPSSISTGIQVTRGGAACQGSLQGIPFYQEALPHGWEQMRNGRGNRAIMRALQEHAPDYVITSDGDYLPLFAAWFSNLPGAHIFNAPLAIQQFAASGYSRFLKGRTVFANSRFCQERIRSLLNLDAVLWYTPVTFCTYQENRRRTGRIGFSSTLAKVKGDEIVIEVFKRMPERSFTVVGGHFDRQSIAALQNVDYWDQILDMTRFYEEIDLLLVPSLCEESFPRVILEAAANGIPVIANRRGGIPEALGESGVLIDWDQSQAPDIAAIAGQYVREIRRLMDDETLYSQYSRKALARAREYDAEQTRLGLEVYDRYFR